MHVVINVDQLKESSTKPKGRRRNSRIQLFFNYSKSWPCTFSELDDKEVQRKRDSEKSLGRYSFYIVRPRGRRMPCLSGSIFFSSGLRRRSIFWCVDLEWNLIYHYLRREKDGEKERERKGDIKKRVGRDSCYWIKPPSAWWTFQLFVDLFFFLSTPSCGRNQDLKKKRSKLSNFTRTTRFPFESLSIRIPFSFIISLEKRWFPFFSLLPPS